jgi:hypothetical protein
MQRTESNESYDSTVTTCSDLTPEQIEDDDMNYYGEHWFSTEDTRSAQQSSLNVAAPHDEAGPQLENGQSLTGTTNSVPLLSDVYVLQPLPDGGTLVYCPKDIVLKSLIGNSAAFQVKNHPSARP